MDSQIHALIAQREQARAVKDWATGDQIRDMLRGRGVDIHDKEKYWRAQDGSFLASLVCSFVGMVGHPFFGFLVLLLLRWCGWSPFPALHRRHIRAQRDVPCAMHHTPFETSLGWFSREHVAP